MAYARFVLILLATCVSTAHCEETSSYLDPFQVGSGAGLAADPNERDPIKEDLQPSPLPGRPTGAHPSGAACRSRWSL